MRQCGFTGIPVDRSMFPVAGRGVSTGGQGLAQARCAVTGDSQILRPNRQGKSTRPCPLLATADNLSCVTTRPGGQLEREPKNAFALGENRISRIMTLQTTVPHPELADPLSFRAKIVKTANTSCTTDTMATIIRDKG